MSLLRPAGIAVLVLASCVIAGCGGSSGAAHESLQGEVHAAKSREAAGASTAQSQAATVTHQEAVRFVRAREKNGLSFSEAHCELRDVERAWSALNKRLEGVRKELGEQYADDSYSAVQALELLAQTNLREDPTLEEEEYPGETIGDEQEVVAKTLRPILHHCGGNESEG